MAARDDEGEEAGGKGAVYQFVDRHVPDHMIDAVEGPVERDGEGFRRGYPHGQRPDEARAGGDGDGVNVAQCGSSARECALDRGNHLLEVRAGGDLGDDPSEPRVFVHRTRDGLSQQAAPPHEGDAGFVARALDAKDQGIHGTTLRPLRRAANVRLDPREFPSGYARCTGVTPPPTALSPETLFLSARSNTRFSDEPVALDTIQAAYELARWAPTANNTVPLRLAIAESSQARSAIVARANDGNKAKLERAPLLLVVARDERFHDLFGVTEVGSEEARIRLEADTERRARSAHDNTLLQAGYLIVALRALGLAVRPYGGFDKDGLNADLLGGTSWKSEMLLGVGHPADDDHGAGPRKGRPTWEHAAVVL